MYFNCDCNRPMNPDSPLNVLRPDGNEMSIDEQLSDIRVSKEDFLNHLTRDEEISYQSRLRDLQSKIEELNIEYNEIASSRISFQWRMNPVIQVSTKL